MLSYRSRECEVRLSQLGQATRGGRVGGWHEHCALHREKVGLMSIHDFVFRIHALDAHYDAKCWAQLRHGHCEHIFTIITITSHPQKHIPHHRDSQPVIGISHQRWWCSQRSPINTTIIPVQCISNVSLHSIALFYNYTELEAAVYLLPIQPLLLIC